MKNSSGSVFLKTNLKASEKNTEISSFPEWGVRGPGWVGAVTLVTYRSERPHTQTHGGRLALRWCQSIVTMFTFQIGTPTPSGDVTETGLAVT